MINKVEKKAFKNIPVNYSEVIRYAGAKDMDGNLKALIDACLIESEAVINYEVCFTALPILIDGEITDFTAFKFKSKNLAKLLSGAKTALIFACTVGVGIDRLIKKYSELNPAKALIFQALGAERVETFTDAFLEDYKKQNGVKLTPRFSSGYGDLSLSTQKDIFNLLNPQKQIGLTLNDSLLMSPSKSVTAIAGINGTCTGAKTGCATCENLTCEFRR